MEPQNQDLQFGSILSSRSSKKTAFIVFPVVLAVFAAIVFAGVSISRTSGLETQLHVAQQQVEEANKVVDERDRQLRDAHAETAALATPGQGAGVLTATAAAKGASGIVLDHPAQHALGVYVFNLEPAPADLEYRLIVTDGAGQESLLSALHPDDRGAAFLLARDVPEGIARVEVALVPRSAQVAKAPVERKPALTGALPGPGEAGVVLAAASPAERGPTAPRTRAQGRAGAGPRHAP